MCQGQRNFRDVAAAAPDLIRPGLLFRSASPAKATPEDCQYLVSSLGVRTVVDFRTADEATKDNGDRRLASMFETRAWDRLDGRVHADRWLLYNPYLASLVKWVIINRWHSAF